MLSEVDGGIFARAGIGEKHAAGRAVGELGRERRRVMPPFKAKVTYMGRERAMAATQTSGDCNACHTQNGANSAPGRILLP